MDPNTRYAFQNSLFFLCDVIFLDLSILDRIQLVFITPVVKDLSLCISLSFPLSLPAEILLNCRVTCIVKSSA